MLSYLTVRLKSQGKFRLHSPFVFDFYEEVLEKITRENWKDELRNKLKLFLLSKKNVFKENDTFLIKEDIHIDKEKEREWEELISEEDVKLTIDCYHFGIIFNMERKEKQHFILRSKKFRKSKTQKR